MNKLHGITRKAEARINSKLEAVYPGENYSYLALVAKLGAGVVKEVVLPTVSLAYEMGIEEKS